MPPTGGPANPNNVMAIVSLVLGIVALLLAAACGVGAVFGVVGVVLGVLGMKKAADLGGTGRGMALAGVVLSAIGIVLSIVLYIVLFALADSAKDSVKNWTGKADPSTYSLKIKDCGTDTFDSPDMTITVTNKSNSKKQFTFDYEFRSGSGSILDTGTSFPTESIPANDSLDVHISSFTTTTSSTVKCEITQVNNWFN